MTNVMNNSGQSRLSIVDNMKAVLIVLVIVNHSNTFSKDNLIFLLFVNPAVPIFMMLSGLVFSYSNDESSLKKLFQRTLSIKRIVRYTLPAMVAIALWTIYALFVKNAGGGILKSILLSKYGPGGYYFPLMVEFLLVAPVLLYCNRKWKLYGLIASATIAIMWELFCKTFDLSTAVYRIIIFRYAFHISLGMMIWDWVKSGKRIQSSLLVISFLTGFTYLFLPCIGYQYKLFAYPIWGRTSMVTALWVFPIVYILIKKYASRRFDGKLFDFISIVGKSSYHIMFVQMLVYYVLYEKTNSMYALSISDRFIALSCVVLFSIAVGIVWFRLERDILNRL